MLGPPHSEKGKFLTNLNEQITSVQLGKYHGASVAINLPFAVAAWTNGAPRHVMEKIQREMIHGKSIYERLRSFHLQEMRYLVLFMYDMMRLDEFQRVMARQLRDADVYNLYMQALFFLLIGRKGEKIDLLVMILPPFALLNRSLFVIDCSLFTGTNFDYFNSCYVDFWHQKTPYVVIDIPEMHAKMSKRALKDMKAVVKNTRGLIVWDDDNVFSSYYYKDPLKLASKYGRSVRFIRW